MIDIIAPPAGMALPGLPGQEHGQTSSLTDAKTGLNKKTAGALSNILGAAAGITPTASAGTGVESLPKSKYLNEKATKGITGMLKSMEQRQDPDELPPVAEAAKPVLEFAQDWDTSDEFVDYLKDTVIPDLQDSGLQATAEDFVVVVQLIKDEVYDHGFVTYLQKQLIPDLKASGSEATAQDFETAIDFIKMGVRETKKVAINTNLKEGDVKDWISSKVNAALISLGAPQEKWDAIEDAVFSSALSGKLGDGTPSDETAQAIASMVTELIGTSAAPTPDPEVVEPMGGGDIATDIGLKEPFDVGVPEDEEEIAALINAIAGAGEGDEPGETELEPGEGRSAETGLTADEVDPDELAMGIEIEKEHSDDEEAAERIALDHLAEIPDYYTRLKKMEKGAGIKEEADMKGAVKNLNMGIPLDDQEDIDFVLGWLKARSIYHETETFEEAGVRNINAGFGPHELDDFAELEQICRDRGIYYETDSFPENESAALETKPWLIAGESVMVALEGELFEAIIVDVNEDTIWLDKGDGALFEASSDNVKPLGIAESYVDRLLQGEDVSKLLNEIVIEDTIRR